MIREGYDYATNPWANTEALSAEITACAAPVDYAEILGDSSVLGLGDDHRNPKIRWHIAAYAKHLAAARITHYAVEAPPNEAFDRVNARARVDLSSVDVGPSVLHNDRSYEHVVLAMARVGIKVVPIDIDQSVPHTLEERELNLANNVMDILAADPNAKIATLLGAAHTVKNGTRPGQVPTMARMLIESGVKVAVVGYAGGTSASPGDFLDAASSAGRGQSEFMMDLSPYQDCKGVVYDAGTTDYIVHLRQEAGIRSDSSGVSLRLAHIILPRANEALIITTPKDRMLADLPLSLAADDGRVINIPHGYAERLPKPPRATEGT